MPAPRKPKKVFVQFAVALLVAVIFGAVALVAGFSVISNVSGSAQEAKKQAERAKAEAEAELERLREQQRKMVKVTYKTVQAVADIVPGQPVTKDMVTVLEGEQRPAPGSATMLSQVVGRLVRSPIYAGETIEQSKLLNSSGFLNIEEGMRAITIQVDTVGGLSGALAPGVHVDVLTSVENEDKMITRTLLQDVTVLSVSDNLGASSPSDPASRPRRTISGKLGSVTVAVSPKQAELLALANQMGSFHLSLRSFKDKRTAKLAGTDLTELMTGISRESLQKKLPGRPPEPNAAQAGFHNVNYSPDGGGNLPNPSNATPSAPKFSMQIYRGTGTEVVDFQQ